MQEWKTLERRQVLDQSPFLVVENHKVELPDGKIIPDWQWIITPDYINVLAETEEGRFLCFRQVKYGVEGTTLAPVGGYLEEGEEPLAAARRELLEETGYEAETWTALGSYRVDANRGAGIAYLFLARGARRVAQPDADDLEEQELLLLSRADLDAALAEGAFKVLAWVANVVLALRTLDGQE